MDKTMYLENDGSFIINNYHARTPFANFLPGIAGGWGIPLWAFYVNRGQAIVSFGIRDKNHAIAEFYPADRAYQLTSSIGFRTFINIDNSDTYEPFRPDALYAQTQSMRITHHDITISELHLAQELGVCVNYFTLPDSAFGALVRVVTIRNNSPHTKKIRVLDGLPRVIPFGARDFFLKNISRTLEAWMYSEYSNHTAVFRLLVDPKDVAQTQFVEGANFNYTFWGKKKLCYPLIFVDPRVVFSQDTSLQAPHDFFQRKNLRHDQQITSGRTPCSFSYFEWELAPGSEESFYSLWGTVFARQSLSCLKDLDSGFIERKKHRNQELVQGIKKNALCVSRSGVFDHYIQSTYFDNILRGGYPYTHNRNKTYYVFSRKHGDLERDYNRFEISPCYFSEGESNYRDVNQNRRMDLFFNPSIEKRNVLYFLNFLRFDGYNPLVVRGEKLYFDGIESVKQVLERFSIKKEPSIIRLMQDGFYLGEFFLLLEKYKALPAEREEFLDYILVTAKRQPCAHFSEGFWVDHWRYNLDLIESFLYFYPDKQRELFFESECMFWDDEFRVRCRNQRFEVSNGKVYQGQSIEQVDEKRKLIEKRTRFKNFLRVTKGRDTIYKASAAVKLIAVILNKLATLDPHGIGIEMEADKPGWCDSLNGLPSLFGSSLCETFELKRACTILLAAIKGVGQEYQLSLPEELFVFFKDMQRLLSRQDKVRGKADQHRWWDKSHTSKEKFRDATFWGVSGIFRRVTVGDIERFLVAAIEKIDRGIRKAYDKSSGLYHTYFYYRVGNYTVTKNNSVKPLSFARHALPLFLESCVHALRINASSAIVAAVKKSPLYDTHLNMFRLNACLKDEPLEIGRSRVFPPGWLENESIWLHMEYKYLLELLKGGFYKDFYESFFKCVVCFFNPEVYGRSVLENSSFIVSSAHADKALWGGGFVARLTGATVEMLNMWIVMCLGHKPFVVDKQGRLTLHFAPLLAKELFTTQETKVTFGDKEVILEPCVFAFMLFSSTLVVYHNPRQEDAFRLTARKIRVETCRGAEEFDGPYISEPLSQAVREREATRIDIYLE